VEILELIFYIQDKYFEGGNPMTSNFGKFIHAGDLSGQVETLQSQLGSLSEIVMQLSNLSEKDISTLHISEQLGEVVNSVEKFLFRCQTIQMPSQQMECYEPFLDDTQDVFEYSEMETRQMLKETRRANKLAKQLSLTLSKVHRGMDGYQAQPYAPSQNLEINQLIGKTVNELITNW
jgi:hypothetical protein